MSLTTIALRKTAILFLLIGFVLVAVPTHAQSPQNPTPTEPLKALQWRSIGPYRGGRVDAGAGFASPPMVFYYGATGGGVWKTTDGGINWEVISDGSVFGTGSVGAIGFSGLDPHTIYLGLGGAPIRGQVSAR